MKHFARTLRYAWPYRGRLAISVACALAAALLWGANLSVIYPVLRLLVKPDQGWQQQLDESIDHFQVEYDQKHAHLRRLHDEWRHAQDWPKDSVRDRRERELAGSVAKVEAQLLTLSREIYWRQALKCYLLRFLPTDRFGTLAWLFGMVIASVAVKGVFEFWQESLVGSVVHRTLYDVRNLCYRSVIHLDILQFSDKGSHELVARFTNDLEQVGVGLRTLFGRVIAEPLRALACIAAACYISWQLTLLFLILVPVAFGILSRIGRMMRRASRRLLERMSNIYKILQETFGGIRVVKAFTAEAHERRRFRAATRDYYNRAVQVINLDAATSPIIELLAVMAVSAALMAGAYLVLEQKTHLFGMRMIDYPMDLPTLLQLYAMLAAIADPVRKLSSVYAKLQTGGVAAGRVFECLDRRSRVCANSGGPILPRHERAIEFRDVCFAYEPGRPALANVNLTVAFGETIALVGKNGSGKTTLLGLLPRFFDPDYGTVLIDGSDVRTAQLRGLRRQFGIVTQDTFLFDESIHANIAYGNRRATRAEVEAAARKAFAADFIEKLPEGYDTRVGETGAKLSGGQRQRLALARAILRDPAVLILDEFTSQCDAESEALIHQALKAFVRHRTTFVITHRLNTLEIADRIVVMDNGRVAAVGTHDRLLGDCEAYQRLHEAQTLRRVA